jgi:hypothetical protein
MVLKNTASVVYFFDCISKYIIPVGEKGEKKTDKKLYKSVIIRIL